MICRKHKQDGYLWIWIMWNYSPKKIETTNAPLFSKLLHVCFLQFNSLTTWEWPHDRTLKAIVYEPHFNTTSVSDRCLHADAPKISTVTTGPFQSWSRLKAMNTGQKKHHNTTVFVPQSKQDVRLPLPWGYQHQIRTSFFTVSWKHVTRFQKETAKESIPF